MFAPEVLNLNPQKTNEFNHLKLSEIRNKKNRLGAKEIVIGLCLFIPGLPWFVDFSLLKSVNCVTRL